MNLLPVNRQLLVADCKSPQSQGKILVSQEDGGKARFFWGVVVARDTRPYPAIPGTPQPDPIADVGDIVYFERNHARPVLVDGGELQTLLHENNVLGVVKDVKAEPKNAKIPHESGLVNAEGAQLLTTG